MKKTVHTTCGLTNANRNATKQKFTQKLNLKMNSLRKVFLFALTIAFANAGWSQCDLYISGIIDGPLSGGTPKGVQLCANNAIPDLSIYGLGSANNGGGSDGEEFTFPSVSLAAGSCIWVASEASNFEMYFGFASDYTSGAMGINGDDAVELFMNGVAIDVYGDINQDGSGQPWEYLDSYAYAADTDCSTTFSESEWVIAGPNVLDGDSEYCQISPQDPFSLGVCTQAPCGISGFGNAQVNCNAYTLGIDGVSISIPYSGMDAGAAIVNNGSGTIGGDDPTSVMDGTIVISNLNEGDLYAISISGGLCDLSINGSVPANACAVVDASTQTCVADSDCSQWSPVPSVLNSQGDNWTCDNGVYSSSPFVAFNGMEASSLYLISSPIDLSSSSTGSIMADIEVLFTGPDLEVFYTTAFVGSQDPADEAWISMGTFPGSTAGGPSTATFPIPAAAFGNSTVTFAFRNSSPSGAAGESLGIDLSGIIIDVDCGTPPTCSITSFGPASISCEAFTANNDEVSIEIPYTGLDPVVSLFNTGAGTLSGDNPSSVNNGTVILTSLNEGDAYSVEISGGVCSGLIVSGTVPTAQCPAPPSSTPEIIISEIMYNESGTDDEWIELCSLEPSSTDLTGFTVKIGGSIEFTFPVGASIGAGECITLALGIDTGSGDSNLFNDDCPFEPDYGNPNSTNNLSNTGNTIQLCDPVGTNVDDVTYSSTSASNGNGSSLEVIDLNLDNSLTSNGNWQDGMNADGQASSPGVTNDMDVDCSLPMSPLEGEIVITEILYDPCFSEVGDDGTHEFLEIANLSPIDIDVSNWIITGVTFSFPAGAIIPGNSTIIVTTLASTYGGPNASVYEWSGGSLSNGGELITILDNNAMAVDEVDYDDANGWPTCADANRCASLVLLDPTSDNTDPNNWFASAEYGGSPNAANTATEDITNAFLSADGSCNGDNVDFDLTFDISGGTGIVEVVLESDGTVLGTLATSNGTSQVLSASLLGPTPGGGTFDVILRDQDSHNCGPNPITISDPGCGVICPFDASSIMFNGVCEGDDANISITVDVDGGSGNYVLIGSTGAVLQTISEGLTDGNLSLNGTISGPTGGLSTVFVRDLDADLSCQLDIPVILPECPEPFGEVIINEIHYNPCSEQGNDSDFEFIELYNNGTGTEDISGWFFSQGVTFSFPAETSIAPGEYIVIAINAATYGTPYDFSGGLSNGGEDIILNDANGAMIDIVDYDDGGGWPNEPDGNCCASLALIDFNSDNNLSASWGVNYNNGSPGAANDLSELMGCTNPVACNFNDCATIDDGSCILPGDTCDDGIASTVNDEILADCTCGGTEVILGCTDNLACNFNAEANMDDMSCVYVGDTCDDMDVSTINDQYQTDCGCLGTQIVMGCMDNTACNFNPDANVDDMSCVFVNDACDDSNPNTFNDAYQGDCICTGTPIIMGCTDSEACNFNEEANTEDDSCIYAGDSCDDGDTSTFNDVLTIDPSSGECMCGGTPIVLGCMDESACNYNAEANMDDGSCVIASVISTNIPTTTCSNDGIADVYNPIVSGGNGPLSVFILTSASGQILGVDANGFDLEGAPAGVCIIYHVNFQTLNGLLSGQNISDLTGCFEFSNGISITREEAGCLDPEADNFNANACSDNGTCQYLGCINPDACNYDPTANTNDGSCFFVNDACNDNNPLTINDEIQPNCVCQGTLFIEGCNDPSACNFDPSVTNNDGSCDYFSCLPAGACQLDITAMVMCGAGHNEEFIIQVSGISGGSGVYDVTIGGQTQSFTGAMVNFGPFPHSGVGGQNWLVSAVDLNSAGCSGFTFVQEVLCIDLDGDGDFENNEVTCSCPYGGTIVSQAVPGSFLAGPFYNKTQYYALTDNSGNVLAINMSGLFDQLNDGTYQVWSLNYTNTTAFPSDAPYQVGDVISVAPGAACDEICGSATYTVSCGCCVAEAGILVGDLDTDLCNGEDYGTVSPTWNGNEPVPSAHYGYFFQLFDSNGNPIASNLDGDFDFSNLAPGTYEIEGTSFNLNNALECFDVSNRIEITIHSDPNIIIFPQAAVCLDADPVQMNAAPVGGTWFGAGISAAGLFNPASAGVGVHVLTYSYDDIHGCSNSKSIEVTVNALPNLVIMDIPDLCWENSSYQLEATNNGSLISGGIWSGDVDASGVFDQNAGVGSYSATIEWTNPTTGCTNSASTSWTVAYCCNADAGDLCPVSLSHEVLELCEGQEHGGFVSTYQYNGVVPAFGNYSYAFILVDANGTIDQVVYGNYGDFTFATLEPDTYLAYGLSYSEDLNTQSLEDYIDNIATLGDISNDIASGMCADLSCELPNGQMAHVIIHEVPEVSIIAPSGVVESNNGLVLSGIPAEGSSPNDNGWFSGTNVDASGLMDISVPGTYEVNYHYFTENGCGGVSTQQIMVVPGGSGMTIQAGAQDICLGETVYFEITLPSYPISGILQVNGVEHIIPPQTTQYIISYTPVESTSYAIESFVLSDGTDVVAGDLTYVTIDPIAPEIICDDIFVEIEEGENVTYSIDDYTLNYSDNCAIQDIVASQYTFNASHEGFNAIVVTVTDSNGNESSCAATVNITVTDIEDPADTTPPEINLNLIAETDQCSSVDLSQLEMFANGTLNSSDEQDLFDYYLDAFDTMLLTPSVSDNSGNVMLIAESMDVEMNNLSCPEIARITINYSALDGAGNASLGTVAPYLSIIDNVAPEISGLDAALAVSSPNDIPVPSGDEIASDCQTSTVSHEDIIMSQDCGFSIERTYTAVDLCGNTSSFVQTIDVFDYEEPNQLNEVCNNTNTMLLEWNPYPGTVACQIKGGLLGGNDPASIIVQGGNLSSKIIQLSVLNPNETYQWRVRCACDLNPIQASTWSEYSYFLPKDICQTASLANGGNASGTAAKSMFDSPASMMVYPNPTSDILTIEIATENEMQGILSVKDILGKEVYAVQKNVFEGSNQINLDLSEYEDGTYLVSFLTLDGVQFSERVIVSK